MESKSTIGSEISNDREIDGLIEEKIRDQAKDSVRESPTQAMSARLDRRKSKGILEN